MCSLYIECALQPPISSTRQGFICVCIYVCVCVRVYAHIKVCAPMLQPANNLFWIVDIGGGTLRKNCKDVTCKLCSRSLGLDPKTGTLNPKPKP